ncbi:cell envelope integrity protein TolA [Alteromonadaceae bacterium BrNp21-10]|nr:cell envelope integrity protein TolA [Alteromonadaceae bacterium BrNp21-10]
MKPFFGAIGKSTLLHIALGVMLLLSVDFDSLKPQPELNSQPIVQAVAIDQKVVDEYFKRIEDDKMAKRKAEEKRIEDVKKKRQQQKDALRKIEQDKKQKLKEKQEAEAAAIAAKKKREKDKAAEDKKKRDEKAAKDKAEQERFMEEQLQSEMAERQKRRSAQVLTEVQKYQSLIRSTIQRNLIVDDSMNGKKCRLNIRLASNGLVTQVKILGGDKIVCEAAHRAVFKSDTLPVSSEPDVYEQLRDINLTVEPEL